MNLEPSSFCSFVTMCIAIYRVWKDYGPYSSNCIAKNEMEFQEQKAFVERTINTPDNDELLRIQRNLIHKGEVEAAEDINKLIDEKARLSEESFILLKSYLDSNEFYEKYRK